MIYQYACNISEIKNISEISDLLIYISEERKGKIKQYRFDKDKIRSMLAELLLRYALYKRYNLADEDIELDNNEYGKPYLKNIENVFFNLSHSGDWVACAVGDEQVGIDVEQMEDIDLSIMNEVFAPKEREYLLMHDEKDRLSIFYNIWTLKESYTKNIGEGLSCPLQSFMFRFKGENILLYADEKKNDNYSFYSGKLDDKHFMSLCVKRKVNTNNSDLDIKIVSLEEIRGWRK